MGLEWLVDRCDPYSSAGGGIWGSDRGRLVESKGTILCSDAVWVPQRGEENLVPKQMKIVGITHILFDKRQIADLEAWNLAIIQPEIISEWYVKAYEDARFILYRLVQE